MVHEDGLSLLDDSRRDPLPELHRLWRDEAVTLPEIREFDRRGHLVEKRDIGDV